MGQTRSNAKLNKFFSGAKIYNKISVYDSEVQKKVNIVTCSRVASTMDEFSSWDCMTMDKAGIRFGISKSEVYVSMYCGSYNGYNRAVFGY